MAFIDSEYKSTHDRVVFGSNHKFSPDIKLREELGVHMKESGKSPYVLMKVPVEEMTEVLYNHPEFNRIHSISLDALECLPWRPDMAFDRWWSAFEVLLHEYDCTIWHNSGCPKPTIDLFCRFFTEVVLPELRDCKKLNQSFDEWMEVLPHSVCRYGVARMLIDREIKIASQYGFVRERAKNILGETLYKAFENEYLTYEKGNPILNKTNHHRAANKLKRVLTDKKITFRNQELKGVGQIKSLEFILSCILYASRCERLHGDYFTPFYSDKAKFLLYAHWYWIADTTYFLFYLLLKRRFDRLEINPISSGLLYDYLSTLNNNFKLLFFRNDCRSDYSLSLL